MKVTNPEIDILDVEDADTFFIVDEKCDTYIVLVDDRR